MTRRRRTNKSCNKTTLLNDPGNNTKKKLDTGNMSKMYYTKAINITSIIAYFNYCFRKYE